MQTIQLPLMVELRELGVELGMHVSGALFASFLLRLILVDQILKSQLEDPYLMSMRRKVEKRGTVGFFYYKRWSLGDWF